MVPRKRFGESSSPRTERRDRSPSRSSGRDPCRSRPRRGRWCGRARSPWPISCISRRVMMRPWNADAQRREAADGLEPLGGDVDADVFDRPAAHDLAVGEGAAQVEAPGGVRDAVEAAQRIVAGQRLEHDVRAVEVSEAHVELERGVLPDVEGVLHPALDDRGVRGGRAPRRRERRVDPDAKTRPRAAPPSSAETQPRRRHSWARRSRRRSRAPPRSSFRSAQRTRTGQVARRGLRGTWRERGGCGAGRQRGGAGVQEPRGR